MAYNNINDNQAGPFWDFVRSMQNSGAGVDHPTQDFNFWGPPPPPAEGPHSAGYSHPPPPPGFPFGPEGFFGRGGFGGPRGGCRGRRCHRREGSRNRSPNRERSSSPHGEPSDGEGREGHPRGPRHGRHGHGPHGPHGTHGHGRGGWGGCGRRGPPPAFGAAGSPFDFTALLDSLASHPLAQTLGGWANQPGFGAAEAQRSGETLVPEDTEPENTFVPPIDTFSTEKAYVLHVALPGAKKEDVGVNWDAEKGLLNLAGVVYRQGDEKFLESLAKKERKVGVFERTVKLPLQGEEKEEVDGEGITAKLEDGVLVVTVPKVEKEESWTEIKRVEIE